MQMVTLHFHVIFTQIKYITIRENLLGFYSFIIKDNISSFKTEHQKLACKYTDRLVVTCTCQVENAYDLKWTLFMRFLRDDNYYLIIFKSQDYMYNQ